ncbi:hypothetical protein [Nostoc sp.]|uniref:hypothetical protein n=1 Tax=Nostoc sp. TaxID=1180 RepID=UPI002FFB7033
MSTMVTELVVLLRGSKLRAASRREVRAVRHHMESQRFGLIVAKILWRQFAYL